MSFEDDVRLIESLHAKGISPGNLLSIAFTLVTFLGAVLTYVWVARGIWDEQRQALALIAQRLDLDENEIRKVDAAREKGDGETARMLRQLNQRIDNMIDGHRGELIPPIEDITREG